MNIRNFCIIAHIDHGKSTLADRFLEITKTVDKVKGQQMLDTMDIEQERGITIKLTPARMHRKGYELNLIDTPGHVDFQYEVSRSLAAVEGAILLVDASQGVQAQTLSVLYAALEQNLTLIPVLNKIDLPAAQPERVAAELEHLIGIDKDEIICVSGKTGENVDLVLDAVIARLPDPLAFQHQHPRQLRQTAPQEMHHDQARALIFDSVFDPYKGVVTYVKVTHGTFKTGDNLHFINTSSSAVVTEVGHFAPKYAKDHSLSQGQIGYIVTGLKTVREARVGDTILKNVRRGFGRKKSEDPSHLNTITHDIIGECMEIHKQLGRELREKNYENTLIHGLELQGKKIQKQYGVDIIYKGAPVGKQYIDLLIENEVVVELKAQAEIPKEVFKQVRGYLNLVPSAKAALLINFGKPTLEFFRFNKDYPVSSDSSSEKSSDTLQYSIPGFKQVKPFVFAGVYPLQTDEYEKLKDAFEKLSMNDSAIQYSYEQSHALGFGFRCGFLGMLHMDIVKERLLREYNIGTIFTTPTVTYLVQLKSKKDSLVSSGQNITDLHTTGLYKNILKHLGKKQISEHLHELTAEEIDLLGSRAIVTSGGFMPDPGAIETILEPLVTVEIVGPQERSGNIMGLSQEHRGRLEGVDYLDESRVIWKYIMPLGEIVIDFYDKLKSLTKGYASMNYEFLKYEASSLVRLDILINSERMEAFSQIVHHDKAYTVGKTLVEKLKELIPKHMFSIPLQAGIGSKIIARETISAMKKDVLAKCYGGDVSRKRKLLEKQKEGKKKMKMMGSVSVPGDIFIKIASR